MLTNKLSTFHDSLSRIYVSELKELGLDEEKYNASLVREITFQITNQCNLRCSYCYEHNKSNEYMSLDTGKKIVDWALDQYSNESGFINKYSKGIILSFIGGEPLLHAKLIEDICAYYFDECENRNIPFPLYTRISFATNGLLWFSPDAQHLFERFHGFMSITVSIDGIKELHDMHRLDLDGNGSFERAFKAFCDGREKYGWVDSKMTFVPDSFKYIFDSVKFMIDNGCKAIACNYAYEPTYTKEDAANLFDQLKKVADYLIDNELDVDLTILDASIGRTIDEDRNFCGGTGNMLSFDPFGTAYPCIRYAPISIGKDKASQIIVGDVNYGIWKRESDIKVRDMLDAITMTSQSEQKCIDCPVQSGCGWCSGWNYELYGTPNKRYTGICIAHKGRVLSSCYYWNRRYLELGDCDPKKIFLPYEEAVELIGKENADLVYEYEIRAALKYCADNGIEI